MSREKPPVRLAQVRNNRRVEKVKPATAPGPRREGQRASAGKEGPRTQRRGGRAEKPEGAWTPEQTADFLLEKLGTEDFYILCPDGEVTREMDEKRIAWAAGDLVENRPPLSRWHQDWAEKFKAWAGRN